MGRYCRYMAAYLCAVAKHYYSLFIGVFLGVLGMVKEMTGPDTFPVPAWVLWGAAAVTIAAAQFFAWLDARKECDSHRIANPMPDIGMQDVIRRMLKGAEPVAGAADVQSACDKLRQMASLGTLVVFGGIGWRTTRPADYDNMLKVAIPGTWWGEHKLDIVGVLEGDDRRGKTTRLDGSVEPDDYYGIWFDSRQVDFLWPPPRKILCGLSMPWARR